jgi:hypothetical protein
VLYAVAADFSSASLAPRFLVQKTLSQKQRYSELLLCQQSALLRRLRNTAADGDKGSVSASTERSVGFSALEVMFVEAKKQDATAWRTCSKNCLKRQCAASSNQNCGNMLGPNPEGARL